MSQVLATTINIFHDLGSLMDPILKNLDPALFQSVILGILMILIFVGEQIFTEAKTQKGRGEFSKMVIFYEILNIVYIPVLAIFALTLFAFFKDDLNSNSIDISLKVLSFAFLLVFIFFLLRPIFKFQEFFRGKRHKFEISFLKNLGFSKILKFRNKVKAEKMVRAWNSFWSEKSEFNERDFTKIFISHIDDAIKHRELELAIQLSQTYVNNIEKRDRFSIGYEILPKIFEWHEKLWGGERLWLKSYDTEKRIQNFFSQKYFPTFRSWALKIYKKTNSKRDRFWNWHYFGGEFFQAVIKSLLKDGHGPYQLFSSFKKHTEESLEKLNKIKDGEEKKKYDHYITGLFASFCPTFFNEIDSATSNYSIWEHDFPKEWKISTENTKNGIPGVILHEFLQWARDRIFKKEDEESFDKDLTEVINGIFPNVHSSLFTAFLMLFFSTEVKYAIEKEPNFYILGTSVSWTGSAEESKEDMDKRLAKMMNAKAESQKEETIRIILNPNFFSRYWDKLKITLNDDNKEKWEKADNTEKESMLKAARKEKLEKIQTEIESDEVKKICNEDERKELYRKNLLELVKLLIEEIDK
jgi:hypothetical protein